jgi:hypothetical protein
MIELTIAIALVVGIVEVFKRAIEFPTKLIPLVSLVTGVVITIIFKGDLALTEAVFSGIVVGLSASGLYDHKSIIQ